MAWRWTLALVAACGTAKAVAPPASEDGGPQPTPFYVAPLEPDAALSAEYVAELRDGAANAPRLTATLGAPCVGEEDCIPRDEHCFGFGFGPRWRFLGTRCARPDRDASWVVQCPPGQIGIEYESKPPGIDCVDDPRDR